MSIPLIISIVDDDESVRIAIDSLVRSVGYSSALFSSPLDFLGSAAQASSACLITDVQMPGMSGLELQARLNEQGSQIPIIFITAFPEKPIEKRALDAGAKAFLTKPFSGKSMLEQIEGALGSRLH
jgi:FixJ family two-component response regulator